MTDPKFGDSEVEATMFAVESILLESDIVWSCCYDPDNKCYIIKIGSKEKQNDI